MEDASPDGYSTSRSPFFAANDFHEIEIATGWIGSATSRPGNRLPEEYLRSR